MENIAKSAVFTSSQRAADALENLKRVVGPSGDFNNAEEVLAHYATLGFQATHFAQACGITRRMLEPQPPSRTYLIQEGEFVEASAEMDSSPTLVYPTIFLGMTANLLGTGCREALRFLLQEGIQPRTEVRPSAMVDFDDLARLTYPEITSPAGNPSKSASSSAASGSSFFSPEGEEAGSHYSFLSALVVSGGGMEHDLRRACEAYHLTTYASAKESPDQTATPPRPGRRQGPAGDLATSCTESPRRTRRKTARPRLPRPPFLIG
ncbi:unnamed protein product [Phytomonas sp. EM1]|nr:unnamed protein product [Phytomonas sp. EM1]|eukprot:CCW60489.1 unnamed protein product [Phytomonas sp. isolate EM1]